MLIFRQTAPRHGKSYTYWLWQTMSNGRHPLKLSLLATEFTPFKWPATKLESLNLIRGFRTNERTNDGLPVCRRLTREREKKRQINTVVHDKACFLSCLFLMLRCAESWDIRLSLHFMSLYQYCSFNLFKRHTDSIFKNTFSPWRGWNDPGL